MRVAVVSYTRFGHTQLFAEQLAQEQEEPPRLEQLARDQSQARMEEAPLLH